MKAILYIGHGTRSKKGAEEARVFLQRIIAIVNIPIQEISFLELTEPSIHEGFKKCIQKGATEITIVPIFLLAAGHIKKDIPEILTSLRNQYPNVKVTVKDPFGVQEEILDAIAELVRSESGILSPQDSLLIVGRGSSDPSIHYSFKLIANGIQNRLNAKQVSFCFLAAAEPTLHNGLETAIKQTSGRVIVIPYLLFSGLLLNEIDQMIRKNSSIIRIAPLSKHRTIEQLVVNRVKHIV